MSNGSIQGQTYLSLQGGELQGNVEMNGNKITGLGEAVNDGDAVSLDVLNNKLQNNFFNQFKTMGVIYPNTSWTNTLTRYKNQGLPLFILIEADVNQSGTIFTYYNPNNTNQSNIVGKITYTNNDFKQNTVYLATLGGIFGNKGKYIVEGMQVAIEGSYRPMELTFVNDDEGNYLFHVRVESSQNTPVRFYAGPSKI